MIHNNPFRSFYATDNTNYAAKELAQYYEKEKMRKDAGAQGDADMNCFAAKLKKADEYLASGESCGATDTIGIILRQMDEPTAEQPVTKVVDHKGVTVVVTRDAMYGTSITIGGSMNPDWIQVSTSVGVVNIDLNDTESLMKCLDMFSPEDVELIMRKIMEVKQEREALRQIDEMASKLIGTQNKEACSEEENDGDKETVNADFLKLAFDDANKRFL